MAHKMAILSNTAGRKLAQSICEHLSIEPAAQSVGRFSDGEINAQLIDNVRGSSVFIVGPTNPPAENLLEMSLLASAAVGSSAKQVILVPTYLGYNRQDRKDRPRVPVSAKFAIDILKLSGAHRALLLDVHSEPTVAHFQPMVADHLFGSAVGVPYLSKILDPQTVVASPDAGGVARARKYKQYLGLALISSFSRKIALNRAKSRGIRFKLLGRSRARTYSSLTTSSIQAEPSLKMQKRRRVQEQNAYSRLQLTAYSQKGLGRSRRICSRKSSLRIRCVTNPARSIIRM